MSKKYSEGKCYEAKDAALEVLCIDPENAAAYSLMPKIDEAIQAWEEEVDTQKAQEKANADKREADKKAKEESDIAQIIANNAFNGETAAKILRVKYGDSYIFKYGDMETDGVNKYFIVSRSSPSYSDSHYEFKVSDNGKVESVYSYPEEKLKNHKQATIKVEDANG